MKKTARKPDPDAVSAMLMELLGPDYFLAVVEVFGGLRIYVPARDINWGDGSIEVAAFDRWGDGQSERELLATILPMEPRARFVEHYGGSYIRVPLAREFRALHYRREGMSDREIAKRLGITDSGVERLFAKNGHPRRFRKVTP